MLNRLCGYFLLIDCSKFYNLCVLFNFLFGFLIFFVNYAYLSIVDFLW